MTHHDIRRLAFVFSIQAEIEGMKAENMQREQFNKSHTYTDKDFKVKAQFLRGLATSPDRQLKPIT